MSLARLGKKSVTGTLFVEDDSYAGRGTVASPASISFDHGLGETVTALLDVGLVITGLEEHREASWKPLGDAMVASPDFEGEFVLVDGGDRLPMTCTLPAVKQRGA